METGERNTREREIEEEEEEEQEGKYLNK